MKILKEVLEDLRKKPYYGLAWSYLICFALLAVAAVRTFDINLGVGGFFGISAILFLVLSEIVGVRGDLSEIEKKLKEKN